MSEKRTIAMSWDTAVAANRTTPAYLVEEEGGWREVSWPEAAQAVDEIAHGLLALGVRKGDAFGILARTRLEWSLFDFALAHVGAKGPPSTRLRPERVATHPRGLRGDRRPHRGQR